MTWLENGDRSSLLPVSENFAEWRAHLDKTAKMEKLRAEWSEYELLDSGEGRKLERFGKFLLVRLEAQAKWRPTLTPERWESADGAFARTGAGKKCQWRLRKGVPARWEMQRGGLKFWVQPAPSGHVGVFPDQACHWDWMAESLKRATGPVKALSLFGHTGLATLAASAAGAEVTHVDASRQAVAGARENQNLSGLSERPIRWIVEDALTFVRRETRRGNQYDALMLDPPRFGRGPDGEIWKLEESLPELLSACAKILRSQPTFVLLNVYTTVLTRGRAEEEAEQLGHYLKEMLGARRLTVSAGKLVLSDSGGREIVASVYARAGHM